MDMILVRPEKCTGCRSCEISCAVQHSRGRSLFTAMMESPSPRSRIHVEEGSGLRMPVMCRHCEEAPCMQACIAGSLYRDEGGFVQRETERCIGCWTCVMTCPVGAVTRDGSTRTALKCDRCGGIDEPACVGACPTGALSITEMDAHAKEKRQRVVLERSREA